MKRRISFLLYLYYLLFQDVRKKTMVVRDLIEQQIFNINMHQIVGIFP